jgi:toxin ParE1/3/4
VRRLTRTDSAERDIEDVLTYLSEHSLPAAQRFVAELDARCRLLPSQPFTGRPRDDLLPGLRSVVVGKYLVFFVPTDDEVVVRRVIHGARDITPEMFGGA